MPIIRHAGWPDYQNEGDAMAELTCGWRSLQNCFGRQPREEILVTRFFYLAIYPASEIAENGC